MRLLFLAEIFFGLCDYITAADHFGMLSSYHKMALSDTPKTRSVQKIRERRPHDNEIKKIKGDTTMEMKFYKCSHCGNILAYVQPSGVKAVCCGDEVTEMVPKTADSATE